MIWGQSRRNFVGIYFVVGFVESLAVRVSWRSTLASSVVVVFNCYFIRLQALTLSPRRLPRVTCVCVWSRVKPSAEIVSLFLKAMPWEIYIWAMLNPWKCSLLKSVIASDQELNNYLEFAGSVLSLRIKSDLRLCGRKKNPLRRNNVLMGSSLYYFCFNYLIVNILPSHGWCWCYVGTSSVYNGRRKLKSDYLITAEITAYCTF